MKGFFKYTLLILLILIGNSKYAFAQGDINAMEYFIDNGDLGVGANTSIPITAGASITESFVITTSGLPVGFHTVYFRVQDLGGEWSISESRSFYVSQSSLSTTATITELRYYFDTDPGYGNGTLIPITPSTNLNVPATLDITTAPLSPGHHVLHVRSLDSDGTWGEVESRAFYIDPYAAGLLTGIEFFYDTDPGYNSGNTFAISPAVSSIDQTVNLSTTLPPPLAAGPHELGIRMINSNGSIGMTEYAMFNICDTGVPNFSAPTTNLGDATVFTDLSTNVLAGDTYSWDFDGDLVEDDNTIGNTTFTYPTTGSYLATLTIDRSGCASTFSLNVDVIATATADAGVNFSICQGDLANLSGSIGGAATSSTWSTSGDGSFNNVALLNAVYTPGINDMTNGTVDLTLTTDDPDGAGPALAATAMVTVTIDPAANANAGIDITICATDMATLTGTMNASSINPMWSTSGSGTFSPANTLNSSYTPSAADITAGTVTLTLTVDGTGTCPQVNDQLIVTIAAPIVAGAPSIQSTIGQASNVDIIAASTINTGDVITVSILQNPTKGTVSILGNNTIDYTPSSGTVGADSFDYQICNQCSLCSSGTVTINIVNAPPVITPPAVPITSIAGQSVTIPFLSLLSDINDNIDPASIKIINGPISNATANFDASYNLTIDYSSTPFSGTDQITVEVCDFLSACSQITLLIEVDGSITINNGISPNGDGMNDYFRVNNIQFLEPQNTVSIYNRWGDKVFEMENYDSSISDRRFEGISDSGKSLPSGVYFYKVDFSSSREALTGYLTIKK